MNVDYSFPEVIEFGQLAFIIVITEEFLEFF